MLSHHFSRVRTGLTVALVGGAVLQSGPGARGQTAQPAASTTANFTIYVRQQSIGTERVSVDRTPSGWTITATGQLGAPLNIVTRLLEARYDSEWRPTDLTINATAGGREISLRTRVSGDGTVLNEMTTDGKQEQKTDKIDPAAVLLPNPFFATYEALAARLYSAAAGTSVPVYIAPNALLEVRVGPSEEEQLETAAGIFMTRRTRFTLMQPGMPLDAEIWSNDSGRLLRLRIPAQNLEVVRDDVASVAARRITVSRPNDEQVRIPANGFLLAGTVSKPLPAADSATPAGRNNRTARLPAVVLAAGASTADRDEVAFGIPIFGQLADALANAGFLVLRYDKRGIGQSGGRVESATLTDYAEDLRAAVRFVSDRDDVDRDRIGVIGYADGGWIALLTAARENRVDAVALVNTPGLSGAQLSIAQVTRAMDRSSRPAAEREKTIATQKAINDAVLTGKGWESVPPAMREQADSPWFKSYLSFDPARPLEDVDQPILIVHGALDTHVLPANADRLAELAREESRSVELVKLEGINHLLAEAKTGEVDEYTSLSAREISPTVPAAIAGWLTKTFATRR